MATLQIFNMEEFLWCHKCMNTMSSSRRRKRRRCYKTGGDELHSTYREVAEELNQGEALKRSRPGTRTESKPEISPERIYKNIRVSSPHRQLQSIRTTVRFYFVLLFAAHLQVVKRVVMVMEHMRTVFFLSVCLSMMTLQCQGQRSLDQHPLFGIATKELVSHPSWSLVNSLNDQ